MQRKEIGLLFALCAAEPRTRLFEFGLFGKSRVVVVSDIASICEELTGGRVVLYDSKHSRVLVLDDHGLVTQVFDTVPVMRQIPDVRAIVSRAVDGLKSDRVFTDGEGLFGVVGLDDTDLRNEGTLGSTMPLETTRKYAAFVREVPVRRVLS